MADIWLKARVEPEDVAWWFKTAAHKQILTNSLGDRCFFMSIDAEKGSDCWVCIHENGLIEFGEPAA